MLELLRQRYQRAAKHDRLGVNAAILKIQGLWENKRLVGTAEFYRRGDAESGSWEFTMFALVIETLLGYLTFTASLMADRLRDFFL